MKGLPEEISTRRRRLENPMKGALSQNVISPFKSTWHHSYGNHEKSNFRPKGPTAFSREMPFISFLSGNLPTLVWLAARRIHPEKNTFLPCPRSAFHLDEAAEFIGRVEAFQYSTQESKQRRKGGQIQPPSP